MSTHTLHLYSILVFGRPELVCMGNNTLLFWCAPQEVTLHVPVTSSAPLFINSSQMLNVKVEMRRRAELFS